MRWSWWGGYAHKLDAVNSIMIGDRKHDIIGAKNNLLKSIGVTYGYGSMEEIIEAQPDYIVNYCLELGTLFSKYPKK